MSTKAQLRRAFAEINSSGDKIEVHFYYDAELVKSIKEVAGARYVGPQQGGPYWLVPLSLEHARSLRKNFNGRLLVGQALRQWGKEQVKREQNLQTLAASDDVPLKDLVMAKKLPKLAEWFRPYQRADVKFLAATSALNLNEQRLGKTTEVIGAIFEAGLEDGPHLVTAPRSSLDTVWRYEIERWTADLEKPHEVITYSGGMSPAAREAAIDEFWSCVEEDWPVWFVCTFQTVRDAKEPGVDSWKTFTIDEYHRSGLPNSVGGNDRSKGSKFSWAVLDVEAERRYAASGTPMGGRPIKLWGGLRFLYPKQFTSKWNWAKHWLNVESNYYGHDVGGIKREMEEDFYASLAPYAIRRLRKEVAPQLPDKQWIDVWCTMTPKQEKQYKEMAQAAEIRIEEKSLKALGILAEYTRLKQFADAYAGDILEQTVRCPACKGEGEIKDEHGNITNPICGACEGLGKVVRPKIVPSTDSGKLLPLLERLAESGITSKKAAKLLGEEVVKDGEDQGTSVAVIASQFKEIVDMVHRWLNEEMDIKAVKITGATSDEERKVNQMLFRQDGERTTGDARVIVMTTTAGGVAITLDLVDNVHILDETWVPDDQEQLADRAVSMSRMHKIGVYVYRSKNTVEEYIKEVTDEKGRVNTSVLDEKRRAFLDQVGGNGN